jgi:hypothetical protein
MIDMLYSKVTELINQYNGMLIEHGIEITMRRHLFKEEVEAYNYQSRLGFLNMLEYIFINKKLEEKKYHHIPNHYKLLVLQVNPTSKTISDKKDCKKYAFLVYQLSRAHQGDKPIEWQRKEQTVITNVETRLKKVLKQAQKSTSPNWCNDTLGDALRYTLSKKYGYLENYCGKNRYFWEILWGCIFISPIFLFAVIGLISSL